MEGHLLSEQTVIGTSWVWTGEPVKCELFANSVGDWLWRQWSSDTRFTKYQWPSRRRDLVNSEPQIANLVYQSRMPVNYRSKHMIAPIKKTIVTKIKNKSKRFIIQPNKLDENIQTSLINEKRVIRRMSEEASLVTCYCYTCSVWRRPTCPLRSPLAIN